MALANAQWQRVGSYVVDGKNIIACCGGPGEIEAVQNSERIALLPELYRAMQETLQFLRTFVEKRPYDRLARQAETLAASIQNHLVTLEAPAVSKPETPSTP